MEKRRFNRILLGTTTDGEIVFADVERRDGMFSASFDMVRPFIWTDKMAEERAESTVDCVGSEYRLSLLEEYDCRPSELVEEVASRWDIEDLVDISLYPECLDYNGQDVYFESSSCGQVDVDWYDYEFKLDNQLFSMIVSTWKEYHLKQIPETAWLRLESLLETYEDLVDVEEKIEEWLVASQYIEL